MFEGELKCVKSLVFDIPMEIKILSYRDRFKHGKIVSRAHVPLRDECFPVQDSELIFFWRYQRGILFHYWHVNFECIPVMSAIHCNAQRRHIDLLYDWNLRICISNEVIEKSQNYFSSKTSSVAPMAGNN